MESCAIQGAVPRGSEPKHFASKEPGNKYLNAVLAAHLIFSRVLPLWTARFSLSVPRSGYPTTSSTAPRWVSRIDSVPRIVLDRLSYITLVARPQLSVVETDQRSSPARSVHLIVPIQAPNGGPRRRMTCEKACDLLPG